MGRVEKSFIEIIHGRLSVEKGIVKKMFQIRGAGN